MTRSEAALARAACQPAIFAERLRRSLLLEVPTDFVLTPLAISVVRNQPFEVIAESAVPFLSWAGYSGRFTYSNYDDSLSAPPAKQCDLHIVWLDYSRYPSPEKFLRWLNERLLGFRDVSEAPILLANSWQQDNDLNSRLMAVAESIPGVQICDQAAVARRLGPRGCDDRLYRMTGIGLSDEAHLEIARMFGLVWMPAARGAWIKAIAVDLDNTLYTGVLGEDDIAGITVNEDHRQLHRQLLEYRDRGVYLAAVSRNKPEDVERLFTCGSMELKLRDFSAFSIGWTSKAEGTLRVIDQLRVGVDSILFVDDNAGELAAVASALPDVRILHAANTSEVNRALSMYPGLAGRQTSIADQLRVTDLKSVVRRDGERERADSREDYFRSLSVRLSFHFNAIEHTRRAHELSNKTNQFNTGLMRLPEAIVWRRMRDSDCPTVTIELQDKLTQSGLIAVLFCRWAGDELRVEEIAISCRALGRELESVIISESICGIIKRANRADSVAVEFRLVAGERNLPAQEWLAKFVGGPSTCIGRVRVNWQGTPKELLRAREVVAMEWSDGK